MILLLQLLKKLEWYTCTTRPGFICLKLSYGVGEMARRVKAPAAKPGNLSSIPRNHMVEGEN